MGFGLEVVTWVGSAVVVLGYQAFIEWRQQQPLELSPEQKATQERHAKISRSCLEQFSKGLTFRDEHLKGHQVTHQEPDPTFCGIVFRRLLSSDETSVSIIPLPLKEKPPTCPEELATVIQEAATEAIFLISLQEKGWPTNGGSPHTWIRLYESYPGKVADGRRDSLHHALSKAMLAFNNRQDVSA